MKIVAALALLAAAEAAQRHLSEGLNAAHSIRYNTCVSLTTEPTEEAAEVLFNEYNVPYTQSGAIVSQKSYVLFNVCDTGDCDYDADDTLYMLDLETYLTVALNYFPKRRTNYCEACEDSVQYCLYKNYNINYQQRKLEDKGNYYGKQQGEYQGSYDVVDCDVCVDYGCIDLEYEYAMVLQEQYAAQQEQQAEEGEEEEEQQEEEEQEQDAAEGDEADMYYQYYLQQQQNNQGDDIHYDEVVEWALQFIECQDSGMENELGESLYASFICNGDGSGVELALFLDEECTVYNGMQTFRSTLQEQEDYMMLYHSQEIVTYPFTHPIDCSDRLSYAPADVSASEFENNYASYTCRQFFKDVMDVYDCNGDGEKDVNDYNVNQYQYYYGEQDEEGEEEEQSEDKEGEQEMQYYYDWYTYLLSQEDLESSYAVCTVVQAMQGEYTYVFNTTEEGVYHYGASQSSPFVFDELTAGAIGGLIFAAAIMMGFFVWIGQACCQSDQEDSKAERFIVTGEGSGKVIV